jgi:flagellar basal body-associated protein FliL
MEEKDNKMGAAHSYGERKPKGNGSAIVIFLAVLAVLLALGGALLLRQLLSARYEAQVAAIEINELSAERRLLLEQLDEMEVKYAQLSAEYQEMEALFAAERRRLNQLRAQLRGESTTSTGSIPNITEYRQKIQELEEQLEAYRLQIEAMENEKQVLSSENAQMRSTLVETTARNQQLESKTKEMEEQLEKATILTISNLEGTAIRERRRGDEPTTKAKRTDKLRVCFNINQNLVAKPGNRDFFVRIIDPNNAVLSADPANTIEFEGENVQYTIKRTINFQNNEQEVCVVWDQDEKFEKGYYNVVVFFEGKEVGYKLFQLD